MPVNPVYTGVNPGRLGETLVKQGMATPDQIEIALQEQKKNRDKLGSILVRLGFATEGIIRDVLGGINGGQVAKLENVIADGEAIALVPQHIARRHQIIPLNYAHESRTLTLAMADTSNVIALDQILLRGGRDIRIVPVLATAGEIDAAIDRFYGFELSIEGILREIETGEIDYHSLDTDSYEYSQPVVRLVNALLVDAVKRGASDIHFEPEEWFSRFRYRIDGVLRQIRSIHRNYWSAIAVRIKIMAGMDITETRVPQDGRISLSISGRVVDFRASTFPTLHGENIVLRILDRQRGIISLDQLDLQEADVNLVKTMVMKPAGIVLVTGPTGSGKTTTLYAILNYLNSASVHIMTLEDPVEYPLALIRQTSVNESAKLDFANGIRSMMRQDPDIILVGEIRDHPTAEMAFRAAMTGHQVYSTLHTNSAIGAIPRLLDIGILPDIMAGNIIGVVAQRLVRKLCNECKYPYSPDAMERKLLGLTPKQDVTLYRAAGCDSCSHHGYKGRMTIMELLKMDYDLDDLVSHRASTRQIREVALEKGFRPLALDGVRRILQGITSLAEVSRIVDLTDRLG